MVLKYAGGIKILIGILMVLCSSPGPVEGQLSGKFRERHFSSVKKSVRTSDSFLFNLPKF